MSAGGAPSVGAPPAALGRLAAGLVGLLVLDAAAIWLAYALFQSDGTPIALVLAAIVVLANVVFLARPLAPLRWLVPGLALMTLFVLYPLANTIGIAFTNYGNFHLLTKEQALEQLEARYYTPPSAPVYQWRAYRSDEGGFLLWLTDGSGNAYVGDPRGGVTPVDPNDPRFGPKGDDGLPATIDGYAKLERLAVFPYLTELQQLRIQTPTGVVRVESLDAAPVSLRQYTYDPVRDAVRDNATGTLYGNVEGTFTASDGTELTPGSSASVGLRNFVRAFSDPDLRGPFFSVFLWTVAFAFFSVFITFAAGLGLALVLNDRRLPAVGLWRSLAIVPYAVPGFISALVWVGLMNPYFGQFNLMLERLVGTSPQWFSDPTLAKVALLFVNLWLGYPYMLLLSLGALQSVPGELYEAAAIDGAAGIARFRHITLPLLLVALGPLLVGSFAFNFNNFTVIQLVTEGGPPVVGWDQPAGATDILISYTFRLAFIGGQGGRGVDYGFAAALSVFIFFITAAITAVNFRMTNQLEQVSEQL